MKYSGSVSMCSDKGLFHIPSPAGTTTLPVHFHLRDVDGHRVLSYGESTMNDDRYHKN